ncbi:hypothetical protein QUA44_09305 [Microcoleus sp. N9_A2]|uniref:hypothetical protein n=1 Tax=unclassified Microcoleus TaxID=2642155 RepID=UPI002FCF098F
MIICRVRRCQILDGDAPDCCVVRRREIVVLIYRLSMRRTLRLICRVRRCQILGWDL